MERIMKKLLLSLLVVAGCATSNVDYNKQSINLSVGMSKADVLSVLGEPNRTDVTQTREKWVFWNPTLIGFTPVDNEQLAQNKLTVVFKDERVASWGKGDDISSILESSAELQKSLLERYQKPPD